MQWDGHGMEGEGRERERGMARSGTGRERDRGEQDVKREGSVAWPGAGQGGSRMWGVEARGVTWQEWDREGVGQGGSMAMVWQDREGTWHGGSRTGRERGNGVA